MFFINKERNKKGGEELAFSRGTESDDSRFLTLPFPTPPSSVVLIENFIP